MEKNKTGKPAFAAGRYFKYAIGEIILVVLGILIAVQLNNWNENKNKRALGYQYLTEMRNEVQDDLFMLAQIVRELNRNIKNHEAALRTKNIATLPLDSIEMILTPKNLDFKISELTFNKMKNLGLTSLTKNKKLNSQINYYYNSSVVSLKLSMVWVFEALKKYIDYYKYQQDAIDYGFDASDKIKFPALYNQSIEELKNEKRIKSIEFIKSIKGRMLILDDLSKKTYSLSVLKGFKTSTLNLLESIYGELKIYDPQIKPLPTLPSEVDFKEITLSQDVLKNYIGKYQIEGNYVLTVLIENMHIYFQVGDRTKIEIFPYEEDKFFLKTIFAQIQFNKEKGKIVSLTVDRNGKTDAIKL